MTTPDTDYISEEERLRRIVSKVSGELTRIETAVDACDKVLLKAYGHLSAAAMQLTESDDRIIADHLLAAKALVDAARDFTKKG